MAGMNFGEGVRKIFLAGVGAVAMGAERSQEIIEELVKRGELTVEQGKAFNEELTRKAQQAATETQESFLRMHLESMTPEERSEYAARVADIADEINAKATTVESEVEEAEEPAEAPVEAPAEKTAPKEAAESSDE